MGIRGHEALHFHSTSTPSDGFHRNISYSLRATWRLIFKATKTSVTQLKSFRGNRRNDENRSSRTIICLYICCPSFT
ncbi:hypothetical protein L218DRAFT_964852 [Marasmius fiardii PR-910]|nr:hypothetical protein L218DRAFT_964852 [Marasmius fiardii PR-910]